MKATLTEPFRAASGPQRPLRPPRPRHKNRHGARGPRLARRIPGRESGTGGGERRGGGLGGRGGVLHEGEGVWGTCMPGAIVELAAFLTRGCIWLYNYHNYRARSVLIMYIYSAKHFKYI